MHAFVKNKGIKKCIYNAWKLVTKPEITDILKLLDTFKEFVYYSFKWPFFKTFTNPDILLHLQPFCF